MIQIACPQCQAQLKAPDTMAGKRTKCPKCQTVVAIPGSPAAPKVDLAAQWTMKTAEGDDYGPVPRSELNEWFQEGRITAECQLLKEGSDQWQWASDVYPSLDPAVAAARARQAQQQAAKAQAARAQSAHPTAAAAGPSKTAPATAMSKGPAKLTPVDDVETLQPWSEPEPDYGLAPLGATGIMDLGAMSGQLATLPSVPQPAGLSTPVKNPLSTAGGDGTHEPIEEESLGQRIGLTMMGLMVVFLSFQMVDGWAMGFKVPPALGFLLAFAVGAVGGALAGGRHFIPGAIGGAIGCVGAVMAQTAHLAMVDVTYKAIMVVVACAGAAPGYGIFHALKFMQDSILPRR